MEPVGFHGILIQLGVTRWCWSRCSVICACPQILAYLCIGIVVGPYGRKCRVSWWYPWP